MDALRGQPNLYHTPKGGTYKECGSRRRADQAYAWPANEVDGLVGQTAEVTPQSGGSAMPDVKTSGLQFHKTSPTFSSYSTYDALHVESS